MKTTRFTVRPPALKEVKECKILLQLLKAETRLPIVIRIVDAISLLWNSYHEEE